MRSQITGILFWVSITAGIIIRIYLSTVGHNFDIRSYWIVSEITAQGGSVYQQTDRYNYGPVWYWILSGFRRLMMEFQIYSIACLHIIVASFLTLIDGILCLFLKSTVNRKAGIFFFLNPVSILISGYHSQFDNLAICIMLFGYFYLIKVFGFASGGIAPKIALGISLITKHIFIFFPLWIFWKEEKLPLYKRLIRLCIPCFFPFVFLAWHILISQDIESIYTNIISYRGAHKKSLAFELIRFIIADSSAGYKLSEYLAFLVFIAVMISFPLIAKKIFTSINDEKDMILVYLITLVAFSSAVSDQYLAIPLLAIARYYKSIISWAYTLTATFALITSRDNLFRGKYQWLRFYENSWAQACLVILLIIMYISPQKFFRPRPD